MGIEVKDESWEMAGFEDSTYTVLFRCKGFRVGARKIEGHFECPDGKKLSAHRIRIQADAPMFKSDTPCGLFRPKSPTHASCVVPEPMVLVALSNALAFCVSQMVHVTWAAGTPKPEEMN